MIDRTNNGLFRFLSRLRTITVGRPIHTRPHRSGTLRRLQCRLEEANSGPTDMGGFFPLAEDRDPFSAPRSRTQARPSGEGPLSLCCLYLMMGSVLPGWLGPEYGSGECLK